MFKVIQTKILNKCFRKLARHGKKGKDAITKVRAALTEASTEGCIGLKRTNHGESRLENIEKFDLGDGYRLIVQLVDGKNSIRAFLFAGDHDDAQSWLDSHKDYVWVESDKDKILEFVQISEKEPRVNRVVDPDLDSPEELLSIPLLRHLTKNDWESLCVDGELKEYVMGINSEMWECDPNSILQHIENISSLDNAILFDDLFSHSHKGELNELEARISLARGEAKISSGSDLAKIMQEPQNSEVFVTWEEVKQLPENSSWSDWLLFLHPEQKELATKEFRGPARLRGVSGSGKTCVMLHRARYLAKKYKEPILLVTLTESMRKLLELLISELCGVEASYIQTLTINGLALTIVNDIHPKGQSAYRVSRSKGSSDLLDNIVQFVKSHEGFSSTRLAKSDYIDIKRFVEDEVYFIRSRLRYSEFDTYLDPKSFKRRGRKIALSAEGRKVFRDAAEYKSNELKKLFQLDYEGVVSAAVSLLVDDFGTLGSFGWASVDAEKLVHTKDNYSPFRCVLVDEVQDLSQLEVAMIGAIPVAKNEKLSDIENGVFLVGDGAQTIYNKGFVLKNCGINVSNRSYVLKKNYRNSREIMTASYALIEKYEFADVDEDNISNPTKPDFPAKCGEKPFIVKCRKIEDEVEFICRFISSLIDDFQVLEESNDYPEICVIGLNSKVRSEIGNRLKSNSIHWNELKQSVGIDSRKSISISTIESAKGHEFRYVFIAGVIEGVMPSKYSGEDDISREASRLYVAMTRAQECLYISYHTDSGRSASRFLIDVQEHCNEYEWRSDELKLME